MPHISETSKAHLRVKGKVTESKELAFVVYKACVDFLNNSSKEYDDYAKIIGVLESCKMEFDRRKLKVFEDEAIQRNGEVK